MAFPTTAVLDAFNTGASQNLTARAGWSASIFPSAGVTYVTNATPTVATCIGAGGGNQWGTAFADMEAYVTLTVFNSASDTFEIAARVTNVGASYTYYAVRMANSAATDLQIVKWNSGVKTNIGTLQSQAFTAGDSVGISVIGTTIKSYYKVGAGAWTLKDTVTDASITGSGRVGFNHVFSFTNTLDNFGGGLATAGTVFSKSITGSAQFVGIRPKVAAQRKLPALLSFSGSEVAHPTARRVTASFTPSGSLARQLSLFRTLTGVLSFSGARTAATAYVRSLVGASITPVGAQTRIKAVSKSVSGALSFVGAQTRVAQKLFTAIFQPVGVATRIATMSRTLASASLAFSGALKRKTNRTLTGAAQYVGMVITSIGGSHLTASFRPTGAPVTHGLPARTLFAGFQATSTIARFTSRQLVSSLIASGVMHTQYLPPTPPPFPGGGGFGALMSDAHFQRYQVDGKWRGVKRVRA